jgi:hypothetical protein
MGFIEKSRHFKERLTERLAQFGIPYSNVAAEMQAVLRTDWGKKTSYAIKLKEFDEFYGQKDGDHYERKASNGENLWVVIRPDPDGVPSLITFFFRRRDQPSTAQSLDVNMIIYAKHLMKEKVPKV